MNPITTFASTKESLQDMLRSVADAKTQLPDFQRPWVWDDDHIQSLLASISLAYPVGTVMMLETGNHDVRFKPQPVEGVNANGQEPERLILDGQKRLTALYLATLSGKPTPTKDARGKAIKRWYYIDIKKALKPDGDRDEAIVALPEDRKIRNFRGEVIADYSTPDREYGSELFPFSQIFSCAEWRRNFNKHWKHDSAKSEIYDQFEEEVIKRFEQYQMPLIFLHKPTPKDAVCQVFEKVNTGGVPLNVFELLTATFAADNYPLRKEWEKTEKRLKQHKGLQKNQNTDFLQAVSLLASSVRRQKSVDQGVSPENAPGISCKRKEILRLTLDEYVKWAEPVTTGFQRAAKLLHGQKIFDARDLPYGTQLTPLAAIYAALNDEADTDAARAKLIRWYWCGVFGELYGSAVESRFAKDLPEVVAWVRGGPEPTTIADANFAPARLHTLRTRNSAAYKGLHALLLRDGAVDFRSGAPIESEEYFQERVDIHHIFPRDWCAKQGIPSARYESIVNKTAISGKTNGTISNRAPNKYLDLMQQQGGMDEARMDQILASHVIDPTCLRLDEFDEFFRLRETALLDRIERAMGKPIMREAVQEDGEFADEPADDE